MNTAIAHRNSPSKPTRNGSIMSSRSKSPLTPIDIFDEMLDELVGHTRWTESTSGFPQYEQYVDDVGNLVLRFALAGYPKDNLSVEANGKSITIRSKKVDKDGNSKFAARAFEKTFKDVSGEWQFSKAVPVHKDGMLTVTIPPSEEVKMKKIEIK